MTSAASWIVEDRFVVLDRDRTEAVHPAHVVHAIHAFIVARTRPIQ